MAGNARGIRAGKAYVELGVTDRMTKGLRTAQARLRAFGSAVQSTGAGMATAGAAIVAPLLGAAKLYASMGDNLQKMSKRTGFTTEALSELGHVADIGGTSIDALESGLRRMQRTVYDAGRGLSTASDALADLGLQYKDLKGMAPEDQFTLLADRLSQIEDETTRAGVAMSIFGRNGTALFPMIEGGAASIAALRKEARELGLVISTEDAAAAAEFTDAMARMISTIKRAVFAIGGALAPTLQTTADSIRDWTARATRWIAANGDAIVSAFKLAAAVTATGVAMMVLGRIITSTSVVLGAFTTVLRVASAAPAHLTMAISGITNALRAFSLGIATAGTAALIWVAAIAAGVAIGVGFLALMKKATSYTAKLASVEKTRLMAADKQRSKDQEHMATLQRLSTQTRLTYKQQREANSIIGTLTQRYGDLGLSIDATTGKLTGMAAAQAKVNAEMRKAAKADLEREIAERKANIAELDKEKGSVMSGFELAANPFTGQGDKIAAAKVKALIAKKDIQYKGWRAAVHRLNALNAGDQDALTGEGPAGDDATAPGMTKPENTTEARWIRRVAQLKLSLIDDEHKRALAKIKERRDFEMAAARKAGATREALFNIDMAHSLEVEAENTRAKKAAADAKKIADEATAAAKKIADEKDDQKKKDIAATDADRKRTVEDLRLETTLDGPELARAKLALERKRAIADADPGTDLDQIGREFDLRKKLLDASFTNNMAAPATRGTFNARAIQSLQNNTSIPMRTAKAAEATAKAADKIARNTEPLRDGAASFA